MKLISGMVFWLCKIIPGLQCTGGARSYRHAITAASKCSWGVLAAPKGGMELLSPWNRGRTGLPETVLRIPHQTWELNMGQNLGSVWDRRHGMGTALSMQLTADVHGWSGESMLSLWYFTHWLCWLLVNIPHLCKGFGEAWEKHQCENKEKSWQGSGAQRKTYDHGPLARER